jgi:anti-sigma B factor antagonist
MLRCSSPKGIHITIVGGDSRKAQMKIEVQQIDREAVIKLSGRLDITTSPDVRKKALTILAKRECKSLTIDFTGVSYIDTSGLATLLEILVTAKEKCAPLALSGLNEKVRYLIEVNGLAGFFGVESSVEEKLNA